MADALPLLGHTRPANQAITISGGTFVDPDDVRIGSGNPGVMTRIEWPAGSPTLGQYVEIRSDYSRAVVPRIACLLGLRKFGGILLAGQRVEIRGKRAGDAGYTYDLGGDSLTLRTAEMWNGSLGCWWRLGDGLDPIVGHAVRLYNDFTGATEMADGDYLDVGIIDPLAAVAFAGTGLRWDGITDPTEKRRTLGSQLHKSPRAPYRSVNFAPAPMLAESAFLTGLNGTNWQAVQYAVSRGNACALMARPGTDLQQAESIYGEATPGGLEVVSHRLSRGTDWRISEIPAQPA